MGSPVASPKEGESPLTVGCFTSSLAHVGQLSGTCRPAPWLVSPGSLAIVAQLSGTCRPALSLCLPASRHLRGCFPSFARLFPALFAVAYPVLLLLTKVSIIFQTTKYLRTFFQVFLELFSCTFPFSAARSDLSRSSVGFVVRPSGEDKRTRGQEDRNGLKVDIGLLLVAVFI